MQFWSHAYLISEYGPMYLHSYNKVNIKSNFRWPPKGEAWDKGPVFYFWNRRWAKKNLRYDIIGVNFVLTICFSRVKEQSLCCMPQFWKRSIYILTGFCRLFIIMMDLRYWIRRKWFVMSKWHLGTVFSLTEQSLVLGWKGNWVALNPFFYFSNSHVH